MLSDPIVKAETEKLRDIWMEETPTEDHPKPAVAKMCIEQSKEIIERALLEAMVNETKNSEELKIHITAGLAAIFHFGVRIGSDLKHKAMLDGFTECDCPAKEH